MYKEDDVIIKKLGDSIKKTRCLLNKELEEKNKHQDKDPNFLKSDSFFFSTMHLKMTVKLLNFIMM